MDFQTSSQPESGRAEQIVSQFLLKCLHLILDSRIPSLGSNDRSSSGSKMRFASQVRRTDKWFSLVLGDRPSVLDNLNFWQRNLMDPMIIDIILLHHQPSSSSSSAPNVETVIERWVIQYESPRLLPPESSSLAYKKTYKKLIILLRALLSTMRLLPAYRLFRKLCSSDQSFNFDIIYKVSSFSEPFARSEGCVMKEYAFAPVEAHPGCLSAAVTYYPTLSIFNLEPAASLPTMIITDYVGSPSADRLKSFASSDKGVRAISVPHKAIRPPLSSPFQRPHSWTSGFHKPIPSAYNPTFSASPPTYPSSPHSYGFPSPSPPDIYQHRAHGRPSTHHFAASFDDHQLSPPFSSSPSPSPPAYHFSSSPMTVQSPLRRESAPVSIPVPLMNRTPKYASPNSSDPSRYSLPPFSPITTKLDPLLRNSPSGNRSSRKADALVTSEMYSGLNNHYINQKVHDIKGDSGRSSGLSSSDSPRVGFSISSSKVSFQDDDELFSCPFDFDEFGPSTSQNPDARMSSEYSTHLQSSGRTSQDAAVGVLVHVLRTAPPLRQDSSSSVQSIQIDVSENASSNSMFLPRRASDALEELKSYGQLKDMLMTKSGTRLINRKV
uniref:Autophagy-related protein 13 N-terminal domain-containing protein n=1 Tax=Kalanchoe fedtschenkoi TaxID=63787 RepID=A0A7N0UP63_KALFE